MIEQNLLNSPTSPPPSSHLKQYLLLALLLLLYLATALAYAALAPLTTGPDELAHYEYVRFIAEHGRLPLNNEERAQASYKSDQPPLYHLIAALPSAWVDPSGPPFLKRVSDHPRRQLIERTRHAWGLYNTEDERWPFSAEVLRWQVGRWVAILFGAVTVALTFFIARDVFRLTADRRPPTTDPRPETADRRPAQPFIHNSPFTLHNLQFLLPLAAAAIVAFIPRYGLTGSMLNYETTLAFFASLFLWVLVRMANERMANNQPLRFTLYVLLLGLFAGLAILTKLSALVLPLEAAVGLWLIIRNRPDTPRWKLWLRDVLIMGVTTLVVISLWFGFVIYQFNTVAVDGWWTGLLRPLVAADASDATTNQLLSLLTGGQAGFTGAIENLESGPPWEWVQVFFRTLWLVPIETVQPFGSRPLTAMLVLCCIAAAGLILAWRQGDRRSETADRRLQTTDRKPEVGDVPHPPTPYSLLPTPYSRLLLSLLLLHLVTPLILPLLRYAVTFSLADTAQGRHLLFSAAPAMAILLVWGLQVAGDRVASSRVAGSGVTGNRVAGSKIAGSRLINHYVLRFMFYALYFIPFLPALLLLVWTSAHLWTMTWAYHPPLPVSTRPEASAQAGQPVNHAFNQFVTLVGYNSQLDPLEHLLRLDLIWQADAVSPVDYLTEVTLRDAAREIKAQWLGHPATGRYPTRAWDTGDIIRDTVWLPVAGLEPGVYQLSLNLRPTSHTYPPEAAASPLELTAVNLSNPGLRVFNGNLPFTGLAETGGGYSVWQNGRALTGPQPFGYRETVLVTLSPLLPDQQRTVRMVGPDPAHPFEPILEVNNTALFSVGPDWPTGDYHLQVTLTSPGESEPQLANSGAVLRVNDLWQRNFTEPAMSHRVEANFADQVKLVGYDLGANRAEPGGGFPLTLYWQGLDWLGNDYTLFTKLIKADDQSAHGGRDRLPREGYHTLYWAPGEIVTDPFGLPVDPDAPEGIYTLKVGLYKEVNKQAISLPLMQAGGPTEATSVTLGPVKIGRTPPGLTIPAADPQITLNQPFGDPPALTLLGYDLTNETNLHAHQMGSPTSNLPLTLYWHSESPLPSDYTTFVHLRNAAGETVAQKDQPPLNGAYPTSLWEPGEIISDSLTIPLPPDLPPGDYQLVVGLYDFQTGQRLTVPDSPANEVNLTHVTR